MLLVINFLETHAIKDLSEELFIMFFNFNSDFWEIRIMNTTIT